MGVLNCDFRNYTPLDWFRTVTQVIAVFTLLISIHEFAIIPFSRDDHSDRKYILLSNAILAGILALVILLFTVVSGAGPDAKYGQRGPRAICLHAAIILLSIGITATAILLFIQINGIKWPNIKSELEACKKDFGPKENWPAQVSDGDDDVTKKRSYCANLHNFTESIGTNFCDEIFDYNQITKRSGKSKTTTFRDDELYCVTTVQYYSNIGTAVVALITAVSCFILEAIVFNLMRDSDG